MRLTIPIPDWEDEHNHGVASEDGQTVYFTNSDNTVLETYERISEEEAKKLGEPSQSS